MPGSYIISILQIFSRRRHTNYGIHSSSSGNNTSTLRARIWKYMNLNHTKCIHLRLNDLERITYMNGTEVPMEQEALYLGGKAFSNGSYKKEISHRISNTWHTVQKLDLLWKKAPVSMKWKTRVFDAVIVSKLLYGLELVPFTEQDCNRLDAFQYRGLKRILHIKHPYWSHIKNKDVLELANTRAATKSKKPIVPLSQHLVHRQIKFHGHIIRAEDLDLMKEVSMYQDGTRRKALFRRTGRPRSKWHTVTRKHTIKQQSKNVILRFWQNHIRDNEFDHLIVGAADHRIFQKITPITKVPSGGPVRGSYQAITSTHSNH